MLLRRSPALDVNCSQMRKLRTYKCLQILVQEFNRIFGNVYGSIHVLGVVLVVSCTYGTVRLEEFLAFGAGLLGLDVAIMTMVIIGVLASANHGSKKVLMAMNMTVGRMLTTRGRKRGRQSEIKAFSMTVRGLRNLRVSIGSSFYYDKGIVLTTLQIMLKSCVDLILLH